MPQSRGINTNKHKREIKSILVINALNGVFPLVLRKKYPSAKITCAEVFSFYKHHLVNLGLEVVDWEDLKDVKFDMIVGNPPYQNGNERGGKSARWRKFVGNSWELLNDQGYLVMIVPRLPTDADDLGSIFVDNQTTHVWTNVAKHFPGIGSTFVAWIVHKNPAKGPTLFVNENISFVLTRDKLPKNIQARSIIDKFSKWPHKIKVISSSQYKHTSVADGKHEEHLSSKQTPQCIFKIRRTNGDTKYMWGAVEPDDYNKTKVTFTYSGYPGFTFHTKNDPVGTIGYMSGHVLVKNQQEAESLISLYGTKAYAFVRDQIGTGGMKGQRIYEQPFLSLDRIWTDQDIYKEFGLSQEEIQLIESHTP